MIKKSGEEQEQGHRKGTPCLFPVSQDGVGKGVLTDEKQLSERGMFEIQEKGK